jgi:hypothetical protein
LLEIRKEAPGGFGGKMIIQDRPEVVAAVTEDDLPGFEKILTFFTPQPIKSMSPSYNPLPLPFKLQIGYKTYSTSAHLYLSRRVLHDFYSPVCVHILQNIAAAIGPTSRLLITVMMVPERTEIGDDLTIYWLDVVLMLINGKEKSKKEFEEIVDAAGLEIVKFGRQRWDSGPD